MFSVIRVCFLAAISAALSPLLHAQTSVTLDPVGAMQVTLPGASDSRLGLPFERSAVFQGRIESISGSTVTLAGSPNWSADTFVGDPASSDFHYLLLKTGTEEGMSLKITANTANTLTVEMGDETLDDIQTNAADGADMGDLVSVVPYWSPARIFDGVDLPDQTQVFLYDRDGAGINKAANEILTFYEDFGWYNLLGSQIPYTPLPRNTQFTVRLPGGSSDLELVFYGAVPMTEDRMVFSSSASGAVDVPFSITSPVPYTLGDLAINLTDTTRLFVFGDETGLNKAPSTILTYYETFGWFDLLGNKVNSTFELEPGKGYVLRIAPDSTDSRYIVSQLPEYLSQN